MPHKKLVVKPFKSWDEAAEETLAVMNEFFTDSNVMKLATGIQKIWLRLRLTTADPPKSKHK